MPGEGKCRRGATVDRDAGWRMRDARRGRRDAGGGRRDASGESASRIPHPASRVSSTRNPTPLRSPAHDAPFPSPVSRFPRLTTYARRLGLFSGTMAVVGGIIGGGIFRTPAAVAERVSSPGLTLGAWILGGVVALIGAFCFGELGQRRPKAGGGYVYLRETWGPLPAFLYGWALLLVIATGAIAAVSVTFANYALALLGLPERLTDPVATAAIVLLSGINYVGVKPAAVTQNIFTVLKLAALAALIAVGMFAVAPTAPYRPLPPPTAPGGAANVVVAIGAALVPILFTYGGWQQTNFVAEEIVEPEKNLPRALVLGVV